MAAPTRSEIYHGGTSERARRLPAARAAAEQPRGARERHVDWWRCRSRTARSWRGARRSWRTCAGWSGADAVIADEDGRRAYETDALTAYRRLPLAVVLPASTEEVSRAAALLPPARHQGGGARRRHLALGRRAARRGCGRDRRLAHEPGARDRLREPRRPRRGRHHQPRHQRGRQGARLLLRARSRRASSPARSPATSA